MNRGLPIMIAASLCSPAVASVWTFQNDYAGFVNMAGNLSVIDFEAMPDGQPTIIGEELTDTFNYTVQGVFFSAPWGFPVPYSIEYLAFAGGQNGFDLSASAYAWHHTWIDAELTLPSTAVGVFFPGSSTLSVYDAQDGLIGFVQYSGSGPGHFLGIVSTTPIAWARMDSGGSSESMSAFVWSPIPEPATVLLLGAAMIVTRRRE